MGNFYCQRCEKTYKTEKGFQNHKCYRYCRHCFGKWKTDKGYEGHICKGSPAYLAKQEALHAERIANEKKLKDRFVRLSNLAKDSGLFEYRVGETVFGVYEVITHPTHEYNSYGRLVKKRYEPLKAFLVRKFVISDVAASCNLYETSLDSLENDISSGKKLAGTYYSEGWTTGIRERDVFLNEDDANEACYEMKVKYDEWLKMCSMCR